MYSSGSSESRGIRLRLDEHLLGGRFSGARALHFSC